MSATGKRIFLLSPANLGGIRARRVMSDAAQFALAQQLRTSDGAMLGDVFSFVSGLYFRGKLAYARRFAKPARSERSGRRRRRAGDHAERRPARGRCVRDARLAAGRCGRAHRSRELSAIAGRSSAARSRCSTASGPTVTSCCSAASPRESMSRCCCRSSASGCCFRPRSSVAAT